MLSMPSGDPPPRHLSHPSYRPDIDGLRAIAVGAVVIYHAFPSALRGGFIGVDVFFVISGFLISGIIFKSLERGQFSFGEFYARRVRRIFPALIVVLIACLACGWFLLLADEYQALGKHVASGAGFVSNFALWSEAGYFDATAQAKPLLHLWSLAIEEQFYLGWPLLAWLAYRSHKNLFALTLLVAIGSFAVNVATVATHPTAAFYSPLARFWELMIGSFLAYVSIHKAQYLSRYSDLRSFIGIALIAVSALFLTDRSPFPGWLALVPTVGALLVLSAAPTSWLNRNVLSNRILAWIGLISYPLYLWHWPALFVVSLVSVPSRIPRLIAVLISIFLAAITFLLIEKPIRRTRPTSTSVIFLGAGMAVCGALGLAIFVGKGLAFRLPPQFEAFAAPSPVITPTDCLLSDRADFPTQCTLLSHRPAVFLWGDSHANSLAAGFSHLALQGKIGKLQVTGSACPPLMGFKGNGNSKCEEINQYAFEKIRALKPDIVVLHAMWEADAYDLSKLAATTRQLKSIGIARIVIIGPVPRWNGSLLRSVFRCWRPRSALEPFPMYSSCGLDARVAEFDTSMRDAVRKLDVEYISAYSQLCADSGCLTHFKGADGIDQLETYDYGHLSEGAAAYLVDAIGDELWPKTIVSQVMVDRFDQTARLR